MAERKETASLRRGFLSELFFFAAAGGSYALLTSRLPAIREAAGLGDADVGLVLLCLGIASVTGLSVCGRLIRMFSSRRILQAASAGVFLVYPLAGLADSRALLFCAFAAIGFQIALMDVCMNTQALLLEIRHRGRFMGKLQSGYSFGCIGGALFGSAFAAAGAGPFVNFLCYAGLCIALWLWCRLNLNDDLERKDGAKPGRLPAFVLFCGLLEICAFAGEGTIGDWGSLLLRTAKGASEETAALSFGVSALAMALVRLASDRLREKLGDTLLLGAGALLGAAGLALAVWSPSPWMCLAGFFLTGMGMAPAVPVIMSRAGSAPGVDPGAACSAVATLGYGTLLVLPPALGFVADHAGLEAAFLIPTAFCLLLAAGSLALRAKKG